MMEIAAITTSLTFFGLGMYYLVEAFQIRRQVMSKLTHPTGQDPLQPGEISAEVRARTLPRFESPSSQEREKFTTLALKIRRLRAIPWAYEEGRDSSKQYTMHIEHYHTIAKKNYKIPSELYSSLDIFERYLEQDSKKYFDFNIENIDLEKLVERVTARTIEKLQAIQKKDAPPTSDHISPLFTDKASEERGH